MVPSVAVELYWVTLVNAEGQCRVEHPRLQRLAETKPDLVGRLATFWGPDLGPGDPSAQRRGVPGAGSSGGVGVDSCSWRGFPELLVLADRAGVVESGDFEELVDALAVEAARPGPGPRLGSEPAAERELVVARLDRLAGDDCVRRDWLDLMGEMAGEIEGHWTETGRPVVQRACRARTSQLGWSDDRTIISGWCGDHYGDLLVQLLDQAEADGQPVVVVPSYFSGNGLIFDLPAHLLVGIPAQPGAQESRQRTEPLNARLRALADPTRLAMLDYLVSTPRTVSELARDFGLAQPTVSRHVRLLREAGLVTRSPRADSGALAGDPAAVDDLLGRLRGALVRGPAGGPASGAAGGWAGGAAGGAASGAAGGSVGPI